MSDNDLTRSDLHTLPVVIETDSVLAEFSAELAKADLIAIDTEADSLHCFREKLCLIQISIPGYDEIIDPLAPISMEPLAAALRDKEMIVQGADFDLRMLRRANITVAGVFDTLIASKLIGETDVGYGALVKNFLGIELAKGSQKANWAQRPLPPIMLDYARNDTRYLLPLRDLLLTRLRELGREDWFRQSCRQAWQQASVDRERNPDEQWRISGSGALRGRAAAVLRALWYWRDKEAEARDKPTFHILQNSKMIETAVAIDAGRTIYLSELRGSRGQRFDAAVREALDLPESEWPQRIVAQRHRWTEAQEKEFDRLKEIRDKVAAELRLDPSLLGSRVALETIARSPESAAQTLLPWQLELLGINAPATPTP
ncbi:MAG: HRDC domain-containing protein [Chthoniobacterales bacterium]